MLSEFSEIWSLKLGLTEATSDSTTGSLLGTWSSWTFKVSDATSIEGTASDTGSLDSSFDWTVDASDTVSFWTPTNSSTWIGVASLWVELWIVSAVDVISSATSTVSSSSITSDSTGWIIWTGLIGTGLFSFFLLSEAKWT